MSGVYLRRRGVKKKARHVFIDVAPTTTSALTNTTPYGNYITLSWDISSYYNGYNSLEIKDIIPVYYDKNNASPYDKMIHSPFAMGFMNRGIRDTKPSSLSAAGGLWLRCPATSSNTPSSLFLNEGYSPQTGVYTLSIGQGTSSNAQVVTLLSNGNILVENFRLLIVKEYVAEVLYPISVTVTSGTTQHRLYSVGNTFMIQAASPDVDTYKSYFWVPFMRSKTSGAFPGDSKFLSDFINFCDVNSTSSKTRPTPYQLNSNNVSSEIIISESSGTIQVDSYLSGVKSTSSTIIGNMMSAKQRSLYNPATRDFIPLTGGTLNDTYDFGVRVVGGLLNGEYDVVS